jgi:hypothetical protein
MRARKDSSSACWHFRCVGCGQREMDAYFLVLMATPPPVFHAGTESLSIFLPDRSAALSFFGNVYSEREYKHALRILSGNKPPPAPSPETQNAPLPSLHSLPTLLCPVRPLRDPRVHAVFLKGLGNGVTCILRGQ